MTKPKVLLDKSFLQGSPARVIRELAETHTLLMPDVLFYELISCDEPARSRCFAKFPPGECPVVLLQHLGALLKKEMKTHQPCGLPSENVEKVRYQFNANLTSPGYELPEEAAALVAEETEKLKQEVVQYLSRAAVVTQLFTEQGTAKGESRESLKKDAEAATANHDQMRTFYKNVTSCSPPGEFNPPPAELIGPDWACLRLLQVQWLFGIDIWYRFGNDFPVDPTGAAYERLEHDVLDANYLVLGLLQGSLATDEKKLRRWFRLLRSDGHLYPDDGLNPAA